MAKPWVLDEFAAAWWIKVILDAIDKYETVRIPPILASRCPTFRRVHAVLGLWLQPTNQYGLREWTIRPGLESRLRDAGFDPVTRELVDMRKYGTECRRIDQLKSLKKVRKLEQQMVAATQAAIATQKPPRSKPSNDGWTEPIPITNSQFQPKAKPRAVKCVTNTGEILANLKLTQAKRAFGRKIELEELYGD
jgi:hypothetical protein